MAAIEADALSTHTDLAQTLRCAQAQLWQTATPIVWLALLYHALLIFAMLILRVYILAQANVLSVLAYLCCLYSLRKGYLEIASFTLAGEVILHSFFATHILGWHSNFQYYVFCLSPLIIFNYRSAPLRNFTLSSIIVLGICFSYIADPHPQIDGSEIKILGIFNIIIALGILAYLSVTTTVRMRAHQDKLNYIANIDPLTDLYNRRHITKRISRADYTNAASLILIDVDHFKELNDKYGHEHGDTALKAISNVIKDGITDTDTAARWGGEEFLIFLPDRSINQAEETATVILERLRNLELKREGQLTKVTATLAVANLSDFENFNRTLSKADSALYQGKRSGRNQVVKALD